MGVLDAYLGLYNLGCMASWAYALFLAVGSLARTGGDLTQVWADASAPAELAQWAMLLEVVHALTGAVRSPVFTVFLQVMSRIVALGVVIVSPEVRTTWSCGLMLLSWSLVEVPRYAFYLNALVSPKGSEGTLYPVFWLRYSLFYLLYPTGITGECATMFAACSTASP
jgi:very-long-chain (3R)-3-hydroxyacyl-CoA dehydratase